MNIFAEAARLFETNIPFALATILTTKGSAPRHDGHMLIRSDGSSLGTVGGGMIERHIIKEALAALEQGDSRTVQASMARVGKNALGMDCGGTMEVHIEVIGQRDRLLLVGGGHVNQAVAALAHTLGFSITVVDSWKPNLEADKFPRETQFIYGKTVPEAIRNASIDKNTAVIIATNHEDGSALAEIVKSPSLNIGQLASRRKVATLRKQLEQQGVCASRIAQVRTPVGLNIGAETPAEIALSIMAELVALKNNRSASPLKDHISTNREQLVVIRGAGDLASGVALKLYNSGFQVIMLDVDQPTLIRTSVAFGQALYTGSTEVEGVTADATRSVAEALRTVAEKRIAVLIDPDASSLRQLKPAILIDAILAKRNLGTHSKMAPITIALGPGFCVPDDAHAIIETNRGHNLGRVIYQGVATPNSGVPGSIMGYSEERIIRAPSAGIITPLKQVGDLVNEGDTLALIAHGQKEHPVTARINGKVRGLINGQLQVAAGAKIGDIDPRGENADHTTVSDKARAIAGGVLEAILHLRQ